MSWHRFMTGLARTMKDGDPGAIAVPQAAACGLEVERGADTRDKCSVSASSERLHCTQVYTSLAPRSPHTYTPLHTACCRAQRLIYISEMRTEAPGGRRREEPARRLQCLHSRVHRPWRVRLEGVRLATSTAPSMVRVGCRTLPLSSRPL